MLIETVVGDLVIARTEMTSRAPRAADWVPAWPQTVPVWSSSQNPSQPARLIYFQITSSNFDLGKRHWLEEEEEEEQETL